MILRTYARLLGIIFGAVEKVPVPFQWAQLLHDRLAPGYKLINLMDEIADDIEHEQAEAEKNAPALGKGEELR